MRKNGFTLIELLLVLAIIGIISAIAVPAILNKKRGIRAPLGVGSRASEVVLQLGTPYKVDKSGSLAFMHFKDYDGSVVVYTTETDHYNIEKVIAIDRKR